MTDNTVHPFERAGLGTAPFRCVGVRENWFEMPGFGRKPGGTCKFCGTGILYEYMVVGSDGKQFVVGCDCVQRTNSEVKDFREFRLKIAREKRATKVSERRALKRAEWDAIRAQERKARQDTFYALNPLFIARLEAYDGDNSFVKCMQENLKNFGSLTEKMVEVVTRMLNENDDRKNLRSISTHFGEVDKRIKSIRIKVLRCICIGQFKVNYYTSVNRYLVKLETESRQQIVWFTTSRVDETEDYVDAALTVKEHSEYDGVKQTIVQRVTIK